MFINDEASSSTLVEGFSFSATAQETTISRIFAQNGVSQRRVYKRKMI
jgi:hypothetical protein